MYNTIDMIWIILIFHIFPPTPFPQKLIRYFIFFLFKNSFVRKCTKFNDFLLDILFLLSAM